MNKYEKLIEYVIGEDNAKASELFHEIVVEKSRDIYESLMDDDNFGGDPADEMINDISADEEGMTEADDDMAPEMGGEEAGSSHNDFDDSGDMDSHEMDHVAGDEEDANLEDRIVDVEDQMDALLAEFETMMGGEEGMEPEMGDDMGMEPEMGDDMGMDDEMSMEPEMGMEGRFNEAVSLSKVTKGISNSTEEGTVNKKSTNANNSGAKGSAAKPHQTTGEATGQSNPTVKPGDGTTEPRESKVTEPKKKGEDAGVNKKSLSGS